MTTIKTARAKYGIVKVDVHDSGKLVIIARTEKGSTRALTRKDVGSARWYAALAHYFRA